MKKLLLVGALCLCFTGSFAQRIKNSDDALDKKVLAVDVEGARMATLEMQKELSLDEQQQQEVELLNEALHQQLLTVKEKFSNDYQKQASTIRTLHLENDKALMRILSEQQLRKYLELEGRQHAYHISELDNN